MGIESKVKLWAERRDRKKDPVEFFRENYDPSTTRSQLVRKDPALYKVLWRREKLGVAIPIFNVEAAEKCRSIRTVFVYTAFEYYTIHFLGKTRGEVAVLDPYLYEKMSMEGSLAKVPLKQRNKTTNL